MLRQKIRVESKIVYNSKIQINEDIGANNKLDSDAFVLAVSTQ